MADVSKIKLLDNSEYNIKDAFKSGIYVVKGTQTASTGTWTGALHGVSALYDGLTIMYYLPWAGSGNATLNLTLDDGTTTGAINCYYGNTTRLTTHYGKGNNIVMTYWSAGSISIDGTATTDNRWIAEACYDVNDTAYYVRRSQTDILAGPNKILPYTIVMENADSRWESIVTSSTTASTKVKNSHGFRLGNILFMYANATYNENVRVANNNLWEMHTGTPDARYTFNVENNATKGLLANKPIYLVGTLSNDGLFYLDTTWWTQTLPSTEDGKLYIHIGDAYDYYRFSFLLHRPIYHYVNGAIREFIQDAGTVNGHTVAKDVPANAVFTDNSGDDKLPLAGGTLTGPLGISYGTTATMTYNSTNPQIAFSENGQQGVKIIYSDYDSYRAPYGLKVIGDGSNAAGAWFEVEGDLYAKNLNGNLNPEKITAGYLESRVYHNIHPENGGGIIPFINNDLAFLTKKGGSYSFYSTTATDYTTDTISGTEISISLTAVFDASPTYATINRPQDEIDVIEITCHKMFTYSNVFYIDFGATNWRAKDIIILVRNNNTETTWTQKATVSNSAKGHWWCAVSHTSTSGGSTVQGFNQIRLILKNWNNSAGRIAQVGLINYNSAGVNETFISRGGCSGVYGNLIPNENNNIDLGSSSKKWANGYFTNINGVEVGSSPKFTDTTYESKQETQGGTDLSLVTTGEKYTWNHTGVVNDGTLTIKQNNTSKGTFTANQSGDTEIELTDTTYENKTEASGGTDLSLVTTGDKWNWNRTFPFKPGLEVASLNDLVGLMEYSNDKRCFSGVIKITANIGVGVTGWARIIAIAQNGVNNGTYDIGMFCTFFPAGTSDFVNYALIDGKTTGNYSVSKVGKFVTNIFESTVQITTAGNGQLNLGNNLTSGATGKSRGRLVIFSNTDTHYSDIRATGLSDDRNLFCPNKSGTIAITDDITDEKVKITHSTSNNNYPICFEAHNNTTTYTTGIYKTTKVTVNPSTGGLTTGATIVVGGHGGITFEANSGGFFVDTQILRLMASNEANYYVDLGVKESTPAWCFAPATTKKLRLGSPSYLWTTVYAQSGSINTSDRNEKKDIVPLDESAKDFIMALNPVSYKFKDGESGRTHYGMIAQDVEEEMTELGMTAMDFAGFCKDQKTVPYTEEKDGRQIQKDMPVEGQYTYGLRYEEFIPAVIKTVQLQQEEINGLRTELDELKNELAQIKAMLNGGN